MDDHPPEGIYHEGKDTTHHAAPSPYGIPYRCLYSRTVRNLWVAGRNISTTHMALSSTRVMATCATLGQAAGTAAAIAVAENCDNRGVYDSHLDRPTASRLHRWNGKAGDWIAGCHTPARCRSLSFFKHFRYISGTMENSNNFHNTLSSHKEYHVLLVRQAQHPRK